MIKRILYYLISDMKTIVEIEKKLKELKPVLTSKFFVKQIGYFGSYADGNENKESDLDLLVEFSRPVGWEFFRLEKFLEDSFGLKVDLITKNALKARLREKILQQVRYV